MEVVHRAVLRRHAQMNVLAHLRAETDRSGAALTTQQAPVVKPVAMPTQAAVPAIRRLPMTPTINPDHEKDDGDRNICLVPLPIACPLHIARRIRVLGRTPRDCRT